MAWSHGKRWTESMVLAELKAHANVLGRMPTANELRARNANALACRVSRSGGFRLWAGKLGYQLKGTETHVGRSWEEYEARRFRGLGAHVERMSARHPFDLRVNGWRVDVKAANPNPNGYTWAGLKRGSDCDFFDLLCVVNDALWQRLIIPAEAAPVLTITIAEHRLRSGANKYARFRDNELALIASKAS